MRRPVHLSALLLLLGTLLLAGCSLLSKEPPSVDPITITDEVDARSRAPVRALTAFPAGTREMFATVRVINPVKGTRVEARWFYDKEGSGRYQLVESADVTFEEAGSRHVAFSLVSREGFPAGAYKVEVRLDDKLVQEKTFRVQ